MKNTRPFRLQDLGWLLLSGALGGCAALALAIAGLAITSYGQPEAPPSYLNPSAAVGSSLETVYKAAAILVLGSAAGMAAYTAGRLLR